MSKKTQEIPGFYRDPVTGKYYAETPGVSSNPALKKLKTKRKSSKEFKIIPKITNVVRYLNAREMRAIGGVQESREYLRMRCYMKQNILCTVISELPPSFTDVSYITGSEHSVYGFWKGQTLSTVGTLKFKDYSTYESFYHLSPGQVVDMCEGFNNDFIAVYSPSCSHNCLVERYEEYSRVIMLYNSYPLEGNRELARYIDQIFCCCCNKNYLCHAFGSVNSVICIDAQNRKSFHKIKGRNNTILFDDTGNLMVSGLHTGNLIFYDLRTKKMTMDIEVSKSCLIDSTFLNSNHIIVAGTDNVLCKVDIRNKQVVTEFFSHKQLGIRKAPLSIANNMLCAAGSDNRIRIYDLSGGLPLHEISTFDSPDNKIRGWLTNIDNKTHLYCFEGIKKRVLQIM